MALYIFLLGFLLLSPDVHAMGVLMRVQQMKAMKQHQAQMEAQAEYQAEYGQQQPGAAPNQPPATPTYQQIIDQRNQNIAQAILDAKSPAVTTANLPVNSTSVDQTQQESLSLGITQNNPAFPSSSEGQETVDLVEVWKKLDKKSFIWNAMEDQQAKLLTVSEYIGRFQKEGVKISAPPDHYVQMIDQVAKSNPQMLQRPFGEVLQIMAIVDYDFDNGMDKDALAKAVLGEAGYEQNKKRFTQAQQPQQGS
jgi:hypothetical protein